jgi:hypothetical protein
MKPPVTASRVTSSRPSTKRLGTANQRLSEYDSVKSTLETTLTENSTLTQQYDKLRAAAKFGIPDEVDRLKGSKYEDWEADAKDLAEKLGKKTPVVPKDDAAGDTPGDAKDDPISAAFKAAGL